MRSEIYGNLMQKALQFWHAVCTKCNAFYVVLTIQLRKQCTSDTWIAQNAMRSTIYGIKNWRKHGISDAWIARTAMRFAFYGIKLEKALHVGHVYCMARNVCCLFIAVKWRKDCILDIWSEPWPTMASSHGFEPRSTIASNHGSP